MADALRFSWPRACDGTALEGARLVVEDLPGRDLQVSAIVVLENDSAAG